VQWPRRQLMCAVWSSMEGETPPAASSVCTLSRIIGLMQSSLLGRFLRRVRLRRARCGNSWSKRSWSCSRLLLCAAMISGHRRGNRRARRGREPSASPLLGPQAAMLSASRSPLHGGRGLHLHVPRPPQCCRRGGCDGEPGRRSSRIRYIEGYIYTCRLPEAGWPWVML